MSADATHSRRASERGFRVALPRESDRLSNPLRCAFERGIGPCDAFDDLLAAIDRADSRH